MWLFPEQEKVVGCTKFIFLFLIVCLIPSWLYYQFSSPKVNLCGGRMNENALSCGEDVGNFVDKRFRWGFLFL